jgi:hypothetical protein
MRAARELSVCGYNLFIGVTARLPMKRDAHRQIARNSVNCRTDAAIRLKTTRGDDQPAVMQINI